MSNNNFAGFNVLALGVGGVELSASLCCRGCGRIEIGQNGGNNTVS